jgi:hypothetical protein
MSEEIDEVADKLARLQATVNETLAELSRSHPHIDDNRLQRKSKIRSRYETQYRDGASAVHADGLDHLAEWEWQSDDDRYRLPPPRSSSEPRRGSRKVVRIETPSVIDIMPRHESDNSRTDLKSYGMRYRQALGGDDTPSMFRRGVLDPIVHEHVYTSTPNRGSSYGVDRSDGLGAVSHLTSSREREAEAPEDRKVRVPKVEKVDAGSSTDGGFRTAVSQASGTEVETEGPEVRRIRVKRKRVPRTERIEIDSSSEDEFGVSQYREAERIPVLKPRTFDGSTPWRDYYFHFESVAEGNGWSTRTKLSQLRHALKGEAEYAVNSGGVEYSYYTLVEELERIYGPRRDEAVRVAAEVRQRKLRPEESLNSLAHDIRRNVQLAYGHKSMRDQELDSVEIFCHAMVDLEIVRELLKTNPTTLREAVETARRVQSLQGAAAQITKGHVRKARVVKQEEVQIEDRKTPKSSSKVPPKVKVVSEESSQKVCANCHDSGHYYMDCPKPVLCRFCKSEEHDSNQCPKAPVCGRCGIRGHNGERCRTCLRCGRWGHKKSQCHVLVRGGERQDIPSNQ